MKRRGRSLEHDFFVLEQQIAGLVFHLSNKKDLSLSQTIAVVAELLDCPVDRVKKAWSRAGRRGNRPSVATSTQNMVWDFWSRRDRTNYEEEIARIRTRLADRRKARGK